MAGIKGLKLYSKFLKSKSSTQTLECGFKNLACLFLAFLKSPSKRDSFDEQDKQRPQGQGAFRNLIQDQIDSELLQLGLGEEEEMTWEGLEDPPSQKPGDQRDGKGALDS